MWLGYNQSLRPAVKSLSLNIDMAATAFLEVQLVADFIGRALKINPAQLASAAPALIRKASKAITGIKVAASPSMASVLAAIMLYSPSLQLGCTYRQMQTSKQRLPVRGGTYVGCKAPLLVLWKDRLHVCAGHLKEASARRQQLAA